MLHSLLVLAATEAETSKTAFYAAGGLLAAWAVILGVLGSTQPQFPGSAAAARGVMGLSIVLAAAAMATAVITA